jgi:arsenite methyltransferase
MNTETEIKKAVRESYADIAIRSNLKSGCGCGCSSESDVTELTREYKIQKGYIADADLQLGCGVPTKFAGIKEGDTVVDLGSGAGNDVFIARALVGENGKVIGIDMTPEMINKAERNNQKLGFNNVEFQLGEIENMPLENNIADVVISNCVLNLVPDKEKAFSEIYRILKQDAHFCVSDIVLKGKLPENISKSAAMHAGCVAGALQMEKYLEIIKKTGFQNIEVKAEIYSPLPDELVLNYVSKKELDAYRKSGAGVYSITVVAEK